MDAPEQVRIFSQDVPVPPQYTELEQAPDFTAIYTIQQTAPQLHQAGTSSNLSAENQTQSPPSTVIDAAQEQVTSQRSNTLPRSAFAPSRSGAYINPGFTGHVTVDPDDDPPPSYDPVASHVTVDPDVDAPPSYDPGPPPPYVDALTSSPV